MRRKPGVWWRGKSTPAKVETYTRWSYHSFALIEVAVIGLPVFGLVGVPLALWVFVPIVGHALLCGVTASRALDWTRGGRGQPVRLLVALTVVSALLGTAALVVAQHGPGGDDGETAAASMFVGVLAFGAGTVTLGMRERRRVPALVGAFGAGTAVVGLAAGMPGAAALATAFAVLVSAGFVAFTSVFSVWLLDAVYELDAARETRTRLAVAEERLRFGRDLHDVMGRNLAVIALKSELAVQLARRERPEAVDQMIEVQRIAQESQREVREVVRGYREADLGTELLGARGVLAAAGVDCTVSGSAEGLPPAVQSALGWVVREATTNVLRHGDAARCRVALTVTGGRVVLTVENDGVEDRGTGSGGVPGTRAGGGSGLAGLRERLSAVDGTLEAGFAGAGVFRLVAEVPLPGTPPAVPADGMPGIPVPGRSEPDTVTGTGTGTDTGGGNVTGTGPDTGGGPGSRPRPDRDPDPNPNPAPGPDFDGSGGATADGGGPPPVRAAGAVPCSASRPVNEAS
ncbi:histidine kinase [Streptomyces fructofermentans]|uniref:Histidine kinase n=1 Tax=Streptomyces fructofermentans TaxID=152141 RepID=A0A918NRY4_9ACTN|nr:histidine kinase [Streptomyces fructofermentans]